MDARKELRRASSVSSTSWTGNGEQRMSGFVKTFQRKMVMPTVCQRNGVATARDSEGKMRILDSAGV